MFLTIRINLIRHQGFADINMRVEVGSARGYKDAHDYLQV